MLGRLEKIEVRFKELEEEISKPEVVSNLILLQKLAQERSSLEGLVDKYRHYKETVYSLKETCQMLKDENEEELAAMIKEEIEQLEVDKERLLQELRVSLLPKDPNDGKNIIMEIRAGTGGDEAGLFAADLYRMYIRYAQLKGWKVDITSSNETSTGCIKEVIFEIDGKGAFSRFKYERGVHRVQRVPQTESQGRIHTSAATVAVLPVADEVDIKINPEDLRTDIYHSSGAGGQNVNKVATAVRYTHLPTGIVVACQEERSQLKNKMKAMAVLRARLLDLEQQKRDKEVTENRRSQIGSGERSEKIRTYNFPQDRLTDHRIGLNLHNLPRILEGNIDELIDAIASYQQAKMLESAIV
ncbi:MAG: peptide chain release factor 1 [Chloroflexi bacterium]|nr:peptide chain release factor 1 [Chloroflexota bacterium]